MCSLFLIYSILFNKENLMNMDVGVSKLLTGTVHEQTNSLVMKIVSLKLNRVHWKGSGQGVQKYISNRKSNKRLSSL